MEFDCEGTKVHAQPMEQPGQHSKYYSVVYSIGMAQPTFYTQLPH